jgi:acyl-CoA reductase-like NAD-dependent aldehyde dehydrogenase
LSCAAFYPGCRFVDLQARLSGRQPSAFARHYLDVAHRDGRVIAGGSVVDGPGYFIQPTVVRDIEDGSELVDQEQFSPILPIIRVADVEDALPAHQRH